MMLLEGLRKHNRGSPMEFLDKIKVIVVVVCVIITSSIAIVKFSIDYLGFQLPKLTIEFWIILAVVTVVLTLIIVVMYRREKRLRKDIGKNLSVDPTSFQLVL